MINKIISLDNDDVVLIGNDTFKVIRLKEVIEGEIRNKWNKGTYDQVNQKFDGYVNSLLNKVSLGNNQDIYINEVEFNLTKECEILKIGGKGWEKGKIKINICIIPDYKKPKYNVNFEFYVESDIKHESPLDDLRQMIKSE